jgi:hypothetical protein
MSAEDWRPLSNSPAFLNFQTLQFDVADEVYYYYVLLLLFTVYISDFI